MKEAANKLFKEKERFQTYLNKNGIKVTPGRAKVFENAMNVHGHFTAEELTKVCFKNNRVSRATVYRVLREMLEAGIIRETAFGDKHHHFEHLYDEKPHHHAQCVRCHQFIEFPDLNEDEVYRPHLAKQGFQILGHEMHFYGVCLECQNLQKRK